MITPLYGASLAQTHSFGLTMDSTELWPSIDIYSVRVTESGTIASPSTLSFDLLSADRALQLWASTIGMEVVLFDFANVDTLFGGYVTGYNRRWVAPNGWVATIRCQGYDVLFPKMVVPSFTPDPNASSFASQIQQLFAQWGRPPFITQAYATSGSHTVDPNLGTLDYNVTPITTGGPYAVATFSSILDDMLANVTDPRGRPMMRVDPLARVWMTQERVNVAPWSLTDSLTPGVGEKGVEEASWDYEAGSAVDQLYVKGSVAGTSGFLGNGWALPYTLPQPTYTPVFDRMSPVQDTIDVSSTDQGLPAVAMEAADTDIDARSPDAVLNVVVNDAPGLHPWQRISARFEAIFDTTTPIDFVIQSVDTSFIPGGHTQHRLRLGAYNGLPTVYRSGVTAMLNRFLTKVA